jgi:tetratricopeptide (TPR) repeat protein
LAANLVVSLALPILADGPARLAASRKGGTKGAPSAPATPSPANPGGGPGEFADAFPAPPRPVPPDLQLSKPEEHKAEALAMYSQGLLAEDNADQEKMIELYKKALALDPTFGDLAVKLAYELSRRNDPSGAVQILKDTIKAAPKEAIPYIYLSQLYAKDLKKPDLGLKYAEQALALAPDNFAAYLALYEIYVAIGQAKKAEQLLERAGKVEHGDAKYWVQLGDLSMRLYLKEDGSSEPPQQQKMNAMFRKAAELGKDDPMIQAKAGDYFVRSKQPKEAIPYFRAALDLQAEVHDASLSDLRSKLARCYLAEPPDRDQAIHFLEDIVRDDQLRYETYEELGAQYEAKGDVDKALTNYEHSLLLDASNPRNHMRLGWLLVRAKRYEHAIEIMQVARKRFPDRADVIYILAVAYSAAQRYNEALAAFSDARASAEAGRDDILDAQFYLFYGEAAERAGLFDKAAELIKQSLEIEPNSADACNYLGYMWIDRGEHLDEAGELIKKAVSIAPEKGEYLDSLGWFYFKKGDAERALTELLRAEESIVKETKKDDATVLEHIGDTYAKLGKMVEALNFWRKSLAIEDNKKIAEKIENAQKKVTSGSPPLPAPPKP